MANTSRAVVREAIHRRIRRKLRGNGERPRLAVYRSLNHIYAQVVDDQLGQTIVSASTTEKDLRGSTGGNIEAAQRIGKAIAERALEKGISSVVFDRGGYLYHGRVKALTDAARQAGLNKDEVSEAEVASEALSAEAPSPKKSKAGEGGAKKKRAKSGDNDPGSEGGAKKKPAKLGDETDQGRAGAKAKEEQ
jgi:large subunit ribosomal protein L18